MNSISSQILEILNKSERFRENSLESKFNSEQKTYIDTFPGESLKERFLRACMYGKCKLCEKDTEYVEKMRFKAYCCYDCEVASKRAGRQDKVEDELLNSKHGLQSIGTLPTNVRQDFKVKCKEGHENVLTLFHLRYQLKFTCPDCNLSEVNDSRAKRHEEIKIEKRAIALAKREENKLASQRALEAQAGTYSTVKCKHCDKFTKLMLRNYGLYSPKFCDSNCQQNYLADCRQKTVDNRLAQIATLKPWIAVKQSQHANLKQSFTFAGCGHTLNINYKNVSSFQELYDDPEHRCPRCSAFSSKYQQRVLDLFAQHGVSTIKNDRTVLGDRTEVDVYLPKHRLGIELDGLYWHSDRYKGDNYHLLKTEKAKIQGIKLIHIFSDEYDQHPEIVNSRLLTMIGITKKLNARDCIVKEIPQVLRTEFLERTHLQGDTGAKINLGLYHEATLVAVMSFRKPRDIRLQEKYEWELIRFATELNLSVRGGAGKLLKYFERTYSPKSLFSYADRRWSQGQLYENLGFFHKSTSAPGYSYLVNGKREGRQKYRKKDLLAKQPGYDSTLTEREIMRANGYPQIYDCGQLVFEKLY